MREMTVQWYLLTSNPTTKIVGSCIPSSLVFAIIIFVAVDLCVEVVCGDALGGYGSDVDLEVRYEKKYSSHIFARFDTSFSVLHSHFCRKGSISRSLLAFTHNSP